jgi:hypothetical protein
MSVKITAVKAEEITFNTFLADEDKIGDQVRVTLIVDDIEINAMADTEELAFAELREKVNDHYRAKAHQANLEINKTIGLNFFE